MQADTQQLIKLFDTNVLFQVPLFQRPYVWNERNNWEPLWDDIQSLLDKFVRTQKVHPHFIGAIVLEQVPNTAGSIESRLVIDGQQRFTTLQVFMIAARNLAGEFSQIKDRDSFNDLVSNAKSRARNEIEEYKLWPTNSDRPAFALVHAAQTDDEVAKAVKAAPDLRKHNIVLSYQYFSQQLRDWVLGKLDDPTDKPPATVGLDDRFSAIWNVVQKGLQLVVINLAQDDETQVIFETLNAKGTALLPADLIKNFLFRQAGAQEELTAAQLEKLYTKHWARFETDFWREEIKQGRLIRPRIDIFINHYLSMMTCDEVRSSHLFNAFKAFVENEESGTSIPMPVGADQHIAQLASFADVFHTFYEPGKHEALALFLRRLEAVDTATVYPFLLYAHYKLMPEHQDEFDKILAVLESFLMRRLITNDTPKNYNKFFVDLIRVMDKGGDLTAQALKEHLAKGTGESNRFPTNDAILSAIVEMPLYGRLPQRKVRAVLEALDAFNASSKSEALAMPTKLTIEHVLPQSWEQHWPLPADAAKDPVEKEKATARRDAMLNTLGNLTLITNKLNPSLSNAAWDTKRPELLKFSKLNLTRYFHGKEADKWGEDAIFQRTKTLLGQLLQIWPDVPRATATTTTS